MVSKITELCGKEVSLYYIFIKSSPKLIAPNPKEIANKNNMMKLVPKENGCYVTPCLIITLSLDID